ncbi:MAG: class I SAM-dependent methyltransferase [Myxococcales bacterium]
MAPFDGDKVFGGSIPELYETHLVPLIFAPYAVDLAARLRSRTVSRVLEIAAGTGVVTRALASSLPDHVSIIATDLNQAMLDRARTVGTTRPVEWRQADASQLPFPDGAFDAVVCQFGVMFFSDKVQAFAEARRVLAPGGVFIFDVWDRLPDNEFADTVTAALAAMFPADPPRFMARTPHGYHDEQTIRLDLVNAGFGTAPRITTIAARSRAASARAVAVAYCQGTPLRNEIESRAATRLGAATDAAETALIQRFGDGAVDGKIQALVIEVER